MVAVFGKAEHVLAVDVIAGDLHRRRSEIGIVRVGDGDRRIDRGRGLVLGVVQGVTGGDDRGRVQNDGDGEGLLAVQRAVAGVDRDVVARMAAVEGILVGSATVTLPVVGIDGEAAAGGVADQRIGRPAGR